MKLFYAILVAIALFSCFHIANACSVSTDKSAYSIGEIITFHYSTDQNCNAQLSVTSPNGQRSVLFSGNVQAGAHQISGEAWEPTGICKVILETWPEGSTKDNQNTCQAECSFNVNSAEGSGDSSSMDEVIINSTQRKGYDVCVDGVLVGKEGQNGDVLDGNYDLRLIGNKQHSITIDDGKSTYGVMNFYFNAGMPYAIGVDDPKLYLGPSGMSKSSRINGDHSAIDSETHQQATGQNQPPSITDLDPSLQSPQQVGTVVTWRAIATDPENDPIYYKFWLSSSGSEGQWQVVQDWSQNSVWPWNADNKDVGSLNIRVGIRDGNHADSSKMDAFKEFDDYQIKSQQLAQLDVQVTNDVYSEKDRHLYYCQDGKYIEFRNRIYLIGPDLDKVKCVQYVLHESFQDNPAPTSEDRANNFETWILTWGRFPIKAIITTISGQQFEKDYDFAFKSKVEEAQRTGIPMVRSCEG